MYSGQMGQINLGQYGLLADLVPSEIPLGALVAAENVSFETGLITKAPGSRKYNTSALPAAVVGIFDWWPNTSTQRLIAACANGSIYQDIGDRLFTSNSAIATGLGELDPRCVFVEAGAEDANNDKKLFFFPGSAQVQVLVGDQGEFNVISNPAVDWVTPNFPKVGIVHRARLWAFAGNRFYASTTDDHEDFVTSADILTGPIFPGEGGDILGVFIFKGRMFAFKKGGFVYYLEDTDPDSDNWIWRKLASNFGLASQHGILENGNDMTAVNEAGSPVSYSAVQALGDIESANMLRQLQIEDYFRKATSLSGLSVMHSLYYEAKKQLFFTWRNASRTTNNILLHIDMNKENPRPALWSKDQADCMALRKDLYQVLRPMYGSANGFIYLMDQEDRLTGSTNYSGSFQTSHTDFRFLDPGLAQKNKLFDHLAVEFLPQGEWDISVDVYIDGKFSETITYPMKVRDDGLDSFTLGSGGGSGIMTADGGDGDPLGRQETQTIIKPLHGSGRRLSLRVRGEGVNQNFAIASFSVYFRVSGDQATRLATATGT